MHIKQLILFQTFKIIICYNFNEFNFPSNSRLYRNSNVNASPRNIISTNKCHGFNRFKFSSKLFNSEETSSYIEAIESEGQNISKRCPFNLTALTSEDNLQISSPKREFYKDTNIAYSGILVLHNFIYFTKF